MNKLVIHLQDSSNDGAKKAYVAPAFEFEEVFETTALACSKIGSRGCRVAPVPAS